MATRSPRQRLRSSARSVRRRVHLASEEPARFFFVHVQKTGGAALVKRLANQFGIEAIYPNETDGDFLADGPQFVPRVLLERWEVRRDQLRVVSGHFPASTVELLDADFTRLTLLRHPVERALSFLRHHRVMIPEDHDLPLEAVYEDDFRFKAFLDNHMVKMFSLGAEEMTMKDGVLTLGSPTPEHLERAKRTLESIEMVGLQESLDEFCDRLERRYGWRLGEPVRVNTTEPASASKALLARIEEDSRLDLELFEFARELVADRVE